MKKFLIVLLVVLLLLTGLFFYKGGHYALILSDVLDNWLDLDSADQLLTVEYRASAPTVDSETGRIDLVADHWTLTADTFWTEYADEQIFGLTAEGVTAFISGRNLYLDTGRAYALPEPQSLKHSLERLSLGLLLHGRVTKTGDTYHVSMKTKELELSVFVTADHAVRDVRIHALLREETVIEATMTSKEPAPHPIPQAVSDAMARARTSPPMPLTEPMEVLLPAAENLMPLTGDLKLGVSCGILEISETVQLDISDGRASITRKGNGVELELPTELSPLAMGVLLLRDGEFARTEDGAGFTVHLSSYAATGMLTALVPQAADLGITLEESELRLIFTEDRLTAASLTAAGEVPFLFTTIPVDFTAELTVNQHE